MNYKDEKEQDRIIQLNERQKFDRVAFDYCQRRPTKFGAHSIRL